MQVANFLVESFFLILLIQVLFFVFAYLFRTDKLTDLSYGLTFIIVALYFLLKTDITQSKLILFCMIAVWGLRLAGYLFIRILKIKRDKRFDEIRDNFFKFAGFWFLQAVSIAIIMIPTTLALSLPQEHDNNLILLSLGVFVWMFGLIFETISDWQKFVFKNDKNNNDKWIESGLWKHSRHPNYFGEILCWIGVYVFTIPFLGGFAVIGAISPLYIAFILIFLSGIPPIEKKYAQKYKTNKSFLDYKRRTPILIPKIKI